MKVVVYKVPLLVVALISFSPTAIAVPIEAGLFTQNSVRTCGSPDLCFSGDRLINFASDLDLSGDGVVSTLQILPTDISTQGASSAGFRGAGFTPAISQYAFTGVQTRFTIASLAIQRYEFLADGVLDIGGSLTYSQSGTSPFSPGENPRGEISAGFLSFQMDGDILESDNCNFFGGDINRANASGTMLSCILRNGESLGSFGVIDFIGLNSVQSILFDTGTNPVDAGFATTNLSITGSAGDVFFVGAFMGIFAHLGGFADSRNTLLLELDDPSLVQASFARDTFVKAPARIPEPGTLTLFFVGLIVLAGRRRLTEI